MKHFSSYVILVAIGALCSACIRDSDDEIACTLAAFAAVDVQIAGHQPVVAVTATHDGVTRHCPPNFPDDGGAADADKARDYICFEMGGGEYTITVHGDEHQWIGRVHVKSDQCHVTEISTIELDLDSEPTGAAELAFCNDGSGRNDCCVESPPRDACNSPMLYCTLSCELPSPEAKLGVQTTYTCDGKRWTSNGPSQCVRPGVRKDEL